MKEKDSTVHAIGRRKTSIARLYLKEGSGNIIVNRQSFESYFGREDATHDR